MAKLRIKKGTHALNRSLGGDIAINTILIIFGAFMFIPMFYAIIQSLKPLDELWVFPPRFFVINPTMKNYGDLFRLMSTSWVPFSRYIFNTVLISVFGTFGNLMLASLSAYALKKVKFPGSKALFAIITYALMFNATVTTITNFLTMSALGWVDTYLAVMVPAMCTPLGLYLMGQFIDSTIPDSVIESSRLDGAGEFKTYWYIAMPMVKPAWLTLIIFSFQGLWNMGASIFIQSEQLKTFSYAIGQILAGGIVRAGAGAASTVIMMVVPITVFVISQANIIETMASSGMKD
ncbi:MAG: carbohydrate ABC transporter permease [Oscillospiraceae bacterium]|nr:carbohydrate ABC transporter permease [Oscillospiraceae bacterium]